MGSTCSNNFRDDVVSQVLGKYKNGRVRGMGRGVTTTKLAYVQARDIHVQKLEETHAQLLTKIEELQNEVRGLANGKKSDDSVAEASSASKVVVRCQLLDWCAIDDVVVGEGEYCSSEPRYRIGRVPLGPGAAAVIVRYVTNGDSYVWRPTTSVFSLGQAVGSKIAWPADKIILDNDEDSPTENHTAASSASLDMILIYNWNLENVVIVEGRLCQLNQSNWSTIFLLDPMLQLSRLKR